MQTSASCDRAAAERSFFVSVLRLKSAACQRPHLIAGCRHPGCRPRSVSESTSCQNQAMAEVRRYRPADLGAVLALCGAEGWPSLPADPERATRALTAPGVTTVVAVDKDGVIGFAQLLSDGEIQAFLANLVVDRRFRGRGIGRSLLDEALRLAGGERIDLLSEEDAVGFYERLVHRRKPGFRLYPFHRPGGGSDQRR